MPEFDTSIPMLLVVAALAYLLGSVPFGLVVAKVMGLPDPRTIGSRNIGATNVLRTGSKVAALSTVLLDGAKGLVAVLIARAAVGEDGAQIAAIAAFLGHCFSVFLNFKGGKGVATFLGALLGLSFALGLVALVLWLLTCAITRYSSLSALVAAGVVPLVAMLTGYVSMTVVLIAMAGVLFWRHRENIARLQSGTESKVGASKA